jgi:hypothetical protein
MNERAILLIPMHLSEVFWEGFRFVMSYLGRPMTHLIPLKQSTDLWKGGTGICISSGKLDDIIHCIYSGHLTYYSIYVHKSLYIMALTEILLFDLFLSDKLILAICEEPTDFTR